MANALTTKVKQKKKKRKSSSQSKKSDSAFTGIVGLIDIAEVSTSNAHLLLTKPPVHQPEAGLNPLVDAAAYVFLLMGQLARTRSYEDLGKLQAAIMEEMKNFQNSIYLSNYSPSKLAEYVPISSYLLCTMLDDVIAATPWGNEGRWEQYSLLHSYEQEILAPENFLIILERFIQEPSIYIDIMEFTYVCLNLGFKYSSHSSGFNAEQLQKIQHSLYRRIRAYRGNISRQLSPTSIKPTQPVFYSQSIKSKLQQKFARIFKKAPHSSTFLTTCPTLMEHIINLENSFHKATEFLDSKFITVKNEKVKLSSLPWQLFIGSSQSGKTTLIENSNIKFIASNKADVVTEKSMTGPKNWHWSVSHESVMIDVGSDYLSINNTERSLANKPWDFLLDIIREERGQEGLNGVTLVISYSEIMNNMYHHQLIEDLSQRINNLYDKFGRELPFTLVITKCDLIPGFTDFFADYSHEELYQAWGAKLPEPTAGTSMLSLMDSRFNMLIKRLNNQMIHRLNQEKDFNFQAKIHILGFPLQVEQLKEEVGKIIKGLIKRDPHFVLQGFYLTSATQTAKDDCSNMPQIISGDKLLQSLTIMKNPISTVQTYFVKQLLLYGFNKSQHKQKENNLLPKLQDK